MKILFTLFVLLFSSSTVAEDISDFEIEGMSVGDSLLNYFGEDEINSWEKSYYPRSKKFVRLMPPKISNDISDGYEIHIKNNDKKYIISSIKSGKFFENEIDNCNKFKNKIVADIIPLFNNITPNNYESTYRYSEEDHSKVKSIAFVTSFEIENGKIRLWCVNWTNIIEDKRGYTDNFAISASSKDFLNWLNNEAY